MTQRSGFARYPETQRRPGDRRPHPGEVEAARAALARARDLLTKAIEAKPWRFK